MATKGKSVKKQVEVVSEPTEVEVKPSLWSYVKATFGLGWSGIKSRKLRTFGAFIFIAGIVTFAVVLIKPSPSQLTNDEIVTRVNKELSITGDGNPAVLTVEDESKATQPFLEQAENGDKVLLYYKAGKAVLFRPHESRIIHQGSYTPPAAKVFIRKGTTDDAKVSDAKSRLESVDGIEIASQDNSTKTDYTGITLVSVTDRYDDKVRELEQLFDTKVVRIPTGESFPDADILIIVGN